MLNNRLASIFAATTSFTLVMVSGTLQANAASIKYSSNDNRIATGIDDFTKPKVMFAKSTPVPEPMTILGTLTAVGMGVAIKKRQKNKSVALVD